MLLVVLIHRRLPRKRGQVVRQTGRREWKLRRKRRENPPEEPRGRKPGTGPGLRGLEFPKESETVRKVHGEMNHNPQGSRLAYIRKALGEVFWFS